MEFRVLGPLEVVDGERQIPLGGVKQRTLLALLVLARGRPVSTDTLIENIWNGNAPQTARKSVQGYVSGLREALGTDRIQTREKGYAIRLEPDELDADRLEEAVRSARGDPPSQAAVRLRDALAQVRGEPLEDLQLEPWARDEAVLLEELVLSGLEARIDAELELGRQREVVPELERLVAEHPYREHVLVQLMLALYRSDRQSDALAAYRRGVEQLRGDLGLEPGRTLRDLEQAILRQDPALDTPRGVRARCPRRRRPFEWMWIGAGGALLAGAAVTAALFLIGGGGSSSFASLKPGVVLLDLKEHRVIRQWPGKYFNYPWAFTGNGHFWMASFNKPATEIEPSTGRFLRQFLPPLATGTNLALPDGDSMWFTSTAGLVRYDLRVRQEVARYRIMRGTHRFGLYGIAKGARSIWVASQEENEVVRVNPLTGAVQARIPVRRPVWLSFGGGSLWTTSDLDGVERIDPATNTVAAIAHVPNPIDQVRVGGGFAWATNASKGVVYKIDASGQVVATYATGDGAHEPSYSDGKLWVSNADAGTLSSIDAATGETHAYRFGHPLGTEAALGRYVVVGLWDGYTIAEQLAKLHGKVAKLIVPIFQFDPPDPPLNTNPFFLQLERATCAELLRFSPKTRTLEPDLAAAMPTVSTDRRTYTFRVRSGLRFAPPSGAPVTAQAVRYSIERALSPRLGTPRPASGYLRDLAATRVAGDRISFTLKAPSPDFLERLSLPYYCTVPSGTPIVNGGLQPIAPPSAAPYYMASRWNAAWTVLKRNPNYRGPQPAKLDAIVFREGLDAEKAVAEVEQGEWYGLALDDPVVQPGSAAARRFGRSHAPFAYRAVPETRLSYLALNAGRGPLRDAALRRRIADALDRDALAANDAVSGTAGLLPPALRSASLSDPPSAARGLAAAAPGSLRMAVAADCWQCTRLAQLVEAQLRPLGLTVTAVPVANVEAGIRAHAGSFDLAALTTDLPYPDPASFLAQMLGRDVPGSWLPATTRSAVAALDQLSGRARDRTAIGLAERLAKRDVPVVAYGTPRIGVLLRPELGCRRWDAFDSLLSLSGLCLAGG